MVQEAGRETFLEALVLSLKGDETERVESIIVIGVIGAQDDLTSPFLDLFKLAELCQIKGGGPTWGRVGELGKYKRNVNTHQLTIGCSQ